METLFKIDWQSMFVPTQSVLEIILRGTIMYLGMFVLLRVFRRQSGSVSMSDLLMNNCRRRPEWHGGRFEIGRRGSDLDRHDN